MGVFHGSRAHMFKAVDGSYQCLDVRNYTMIFCMAM